MSPPTIALVTDAAHRDGTADDRLLAGALAPHVSAEFVAWDANGFDWRGVDAALLRSTWDYHLRLPAFEEWLNRLEDEAVFVINPPELVRWNARKVYLRDLARQGVDIVPTKWITSGDIAQLPARLADATWDRAVIKPVVAATSYLTHVVTAVNASAVGAELAMAEVADGFMLQPFVDEVVDPGEWSLMFFDGEFSHGVLKTPAAGDFRVQDDFGGTSRPGSPGEAVVQQARAIFDALPETPLYARVDGVVQGDRFVLIELELIEPVLFFGHDEEAAPRLVRALRKRLKR